MSIKSDKEELRVKIKMVLAALAPATAKKLAEHATLSGISAQKISGLLRGMEKLKEVRRHRDGSWSPPKQAGKTEASTSNAFFVINAEAHTIQLDVGGLRLPVVVE